MGAILPASFDVLVVGGGPGGYVAALRAAQLGASTAIVEKDRMGGTCLVRGCIPTKALLQSTELYTLARGGKPFALVADGIGFDWSAAQKRKNTVVDQLVKGVEGLLKAGAVSSLRGAAGPIGGGQVAAGLVGGGWGGGGGGRGMGVGGRGRMRVQVRPGRRRGGREAGGGTGRRRRAPADDGRRRMGHRGRDRRNHARARRLVRGDLRGREHRGPLPARPRLQGGPELRVHRARDRARRPR